MNEEQTYHTLSLSRKDLQRFVCAQYQKGSYHSHAFFSYLYRQGTSDVMGTKEFKPVPDLAQKLNTQFPLSLAKPEKIEEDEGHIKFALQFPDGLFCESVILKMKTYQTLCISSQSGCRWGCAFCQTGKLGLRGQLSCAQMIMQILVAKFHFGARIKNIVFMGMGEALDNFDAVFKALEIMTDPYGLEIGAANITISTVGSLTNIARFEEITHWQLPAGQKSPDGSYEPPYRNIKLAVSLNASNDTVRSQLMPVNKRYNMAALKKVLQDIPIKRKDHDLFIEYVLIPGMNNLPEHAKELLEYLSDLPCVVNLIPYHPHPQSAWQAPTDEQLSEFFLCLTQGGQVCRMRHSRGEKIAAACGQLGREYVGG